MNTLGDWEGPNNDFTDQCFQLYGKIWVMCWSGSKAWSTSASNVLRATCSSQNSCGHNDDRERTVDKLRRWYPMSRRTLRGISHLFSCPVPVLTRFSCANATNPPFWES